MWIKWFYFGVLKQFRKTACLTRDSCLPLPSEWTALCCFPYVVERKSSLCRDVISLRPGQAVSLWLTGLQNIRKTCHAGMSLLQKGKWQGMSLPLWNLRLAVFLEEWFCSRQTVISPLGLLCSRRRKVLSINSMRHWLKWNFNCDTFTQAMMGCVFKAFMKVHDLIKSMFGSNLLVKFS